MGRRYHEIGKKPKNKRKRKKKVDSVIIGYFYYFLSHAALAWICAGEV